MAETNHLSYVGSNYDPDSPAVQAAANCRYICVYSACNDLCSVLRVMSFAYSSYVFVHSRYCVGALDRKTGTLTLHRAQHFLLKPHIPGNPIVNMSSLEKKKLEI